MRDTSVHQTSIPQVRMLLTTLLREARTTHACALAIGDRMLAARLARQIAYVKRCLGALPRADWFLIYPN
jgi:hypothetical protein